MRVEGSPPKYTGAPGGLREAGARRLVVAVWLCLIARGAFQMFLLPLWEGNDEWAHAAYAQQLASGEGLPVPGRTKVSREVDESLRLAPLAHGSFSLDPPRLTHDGFWRLPAGERAERRYRLANLPRDWARDEAEAGELNYEAQQPPLAYLLFAAAQLAGAEWPLEARVLLMRLMGLLATSLVIPAGWMAARAVLGCGMLAAGVVAVVAAMPMFVMAAVRVANDGVAAAVYTALLWVVVAGRGEPSWKRAVASGGLLGAGLLTKAYFLTAVPALATVSAWRLWRGRGRRKRIAAESGVTMLTAGLIAGWWYWRNQALTGSMSGLQQAAALGGLPLAGILAHAPSVDWLRFLDSALFSHVWFGNWSFLQLRSWMYRVFAAVAAAAAAGLVLRLARRGRADGASPGRALLVPGALYGWFWAGLAYHELTFSLHHLSSGGGWYLYAVVVPEVLLVCVGLMALVPARHRHWVLASSAALFALLDLYATQFLLVPYYTGMIFHRAGGGLEAFYLSRLPGGGAQTMLERFGGGWLPGGVVVVLWLLYLAGTLGLPAAAARSRTRAGQPVST